MTLSTSKQSNKTRFLNLVGLAQQSLWMLMFLCFISLWALYCSLRSNPSSTENSDNDRNEKSKFPGGVFCSPLKGQGNTLIKSTVQPAERANAERGKVIQRADQILCLLVFNRNINKLGACTEEKWITYIFINSMYKYAYICICYIYVKVCWVVSQKSPSSLENIDLLA